MTSSIGRVVPVMRPVTVQIGRTLSSFRTRRWTVPARPTRYAIGRPPARPRRVGPAGSRGSRASRHDSGALMIFGSETASAALIRACAGHGRPARRQRIARDAKVVDDAAALDVAVGPPRALRIDLALLEAIVGGIGVDEDAGGAALLGGQRLETAVAVRHRVADEDDLALHIDAALGEPVVVRRVAAAGVRRPAR